MFGLSTVELIELVLVGLFCVVHVVSNFVSARCNCKLCKSLRQVYDVLHGSESKDSESKDDIQASDLNLELSELSDLLAKIKERL